MGRLQIAFWGEITDFDLLLRHLISAQKKKKRCRGFFACITICVTFEVFCVEVFLGRGASNFLREKHSLRSLQLALAVTSSEDDTL